MITKTGRLGVVGTERVTFHGVNLPGQSFWAGPSREGPTSPIEPTPDTTRTSPRQRNSYTLLVITNQHAWAKRGLSFQVFSHINQRQRQQTLTLKPVVDMIGSPESQTKARVDNKKEQKECLAESMPVDRTTGCKKNVTFLTSATRIPPLWHKSMDNLDPETQSKSIAIKNEASEMSKVLAKTKMMRSLSYQSASNDHFFTMKPKPVGKPT